jgi:hypothetical protein
MVEMTGANRLKGLADWDSYLSAVLKVSLRNGHRRRRQAGRLPDLEARRRGSERSGRGPVDSPLASSGRDVPA